VNLANVTAQMSLLQVYLTTLRFKICFSKLDNMQIKKFQDNWMIVLPPNIEDLFVEVIQ